MKRTYKRAAGLAVAAALAAGAPAVAAGPSPADVRYARAVTDSGFDPADPYWARFAADTCASVRAGSGPTRQVREVGVPQVAYIFGSAVGAYCHDQAAAAAAWFHGQTAAYYGVQP